MGTWRVGGWVGGGAQKPVAQKRLFQNLLSCLWSVQNQGLYSWTIFAVVKQFSHPMQSQGWILRTCQQWDLRQRHQITVGVTCILDWKAPPPPPPRYAMGVCTLWSSLSGTFLQTLPELVMPLKGHSLSPCSCPPVWPAPCEHFGY